MSNVCIPSKFSGGSRPTQQNKRGKNNIAAQPNKLGFDWTSQESKVSRQATL